MAKEFSRTERVADFLKQELAGLIQRELRDPRIGMVSVTGVEVSRDMSHARVYVTVLGKDSAADAAESMAALNHAAGFLRSQVARVNSARTTPKLRFEFDASIVRGSRISHLIDTVVAEDRRHAQERGDVSDEEERGDIAGEDLRRDAPGGDEPDGSEAGREQ